MRVIRTVTYPTAIRNLVSERGAAFRHITRLATEVQSRARVQVGKDTHELERTIVKQPVRKATGMAVRVGSSAKHARLHHEGTRPHPIIGRPLLVFYWPKAGRVVYLRRVNHPGTRPNRYLTDPLRQVVG